MKFEGTLEGNVVRDVTLRHTKTTSKPVCSFDVAVNDRRRNPDSGEWEDAGTTYMRVNAWQNLAEQAAATLKRGTPVVVTGRIRQRSWQDEAGVKHTVHEMTADTIGASLRYGKPKMGKGKKSKAKATVADVPNDPPIETYEGEEPF